RHDRSRRSLKAQLFMYAAPRARERRSDILRTQEDPPMRTTSPLASAALLAAGVTIAIGASNGGCGGDDSQFGHGNGNGNGDDGGLLFGDASFGDDGGGGPCTGIACH